MTSKNKKILLKAIKIGIGSSLSTLIASTLSLEYATTASVITLLTIRNTKNDTRKLALDRLLSFLVSMATIFLITQCIPSPTWGFGLYIVCLVLFSCYCNWEDSMSVNTVIGTHIFLLEPHLTLSFVGNEFALVLIGTSIALLCNTYMHNNLADIKKDALYIEEELGAILISMAHHLQNKQVLTQDNTHIRILIHHIDTAIDKAFENINNTPCELAQYYVEYLNMRKSQCVVLLHFYRALLSMKSNCAEIDEVAEIILEIGQATHKTVGIKQIVADLEAVVSELKLERLPQTADEFISKAQLFYILEELEELLKLKSVFLSTLSEAQLEQFWS